MTQRMLWKLPSPSSALKASATLMLPWTALASVLFGLALSAILSVSATIIPSSEKLVAVAGPSVRTRNCFGVLNSFGFATAVPSRKFSKNFSVISFKSSIALRIWREMSKALLAITITLSSPNSHLTVALQLYTSDHAAQPAAYNPAVYHSHNPFKCLSQASSIVSDPTPCLSVPTATAYPFHAILTNLPLWFSPSPGPMLNTACSAILPPICTGSHRLLSHHTVAWLSLTPQFGAIPFAPATHSALLPVVSIVACAAQFLCCYPSMESNSSRLFLCLLLFGSTPTPPPSSMHPCHIRFHPLGSNSELVLQSLLFSDYRHWLQLPSHLPSRPAALAPFSFCSCWLPLYPLSTVLLHFDCFFPCWPRKFEVTFTRLRPVTVQCFIVLLYYRITINYRTITVLYCTKRVESRWHSKWQPHK